VQADLFSPDEAKIPEGKKYDAVISNPPYIPTEVVDSLEGAVKFEPRAALDGGKDGFDFYRVIIGEYSKYLKDDGMILLEIGYDQALTMIELSKANGFDCRVFKDFGGNDRVALLKKII
jgi:release factor glutamine methyltransferase